ncbi:hypothetical protein [Bradyrhizobium sp. sGM-13]|uniref:hypothetical protein n=1 Tax=Bradyrhizobium sp. sGM-13 TaxID=2831781 RepID=UPI001BCEC7D2|nr:hypothetical protein [Bradyrhizobium sp. sGM-13]
MTIILDPERRRSTHVESGLAVQWVRDEPPMERRTHFKLIVGGADVPFEASYDFGYYKIKQQYPDADAVELYRRCSELCEMNYRAVNIRTHFDKEVFVQVWQNLVQQGVSPYRVSTYYTELAGPDPSTRKEWKCEG